MRGSVYVADSAQSMGNKVYTLGAHWTTIAHGAPGHAVVVVLKLESPDEIEQAHDLELTLSCLTDDSGDVLHRISGRIGAELRPGSERAEEVPATAAMCIAIGDPSLSPGSYQWALVVDGEKLDTWEFKVLQPADDAEDSVAGEN